MENASLRLAFGSTLPTAGGLTLVVGARRGSAARRAGSGGRSSADTAEQRRHRAGVLLGVAYC